jgi:tRNA (cmo5U34)-methyltransferase
MTDPASRALAERLFSGRPITAEYEILEHLCPMAAELSRRVGEVASGLPAASSDGLAAVEIGCGTGITTRALLRARPDIMVTAIDNEPEMLGRARDSLGEYLTNGKLGLVEADALSALRALPAGRLDLVASAYTIHNFLDAYRSAVLDEVFRVLRPGGTFVNGDRYALDDLVEQMRLTQTEARHFIDVLVPRRRADLLQQWILHLFSDASPERVMRLGPAVQRMHEIGFVGIEARFRQGFHAVMVAAKPA